MVKSLLIKFNVCIQHAYKKLLSNLFTFFSGCKVIWFSFFLQYLKICILMMGVRDLFGFLLCLLQRNDYICNII